MGNTITRRSFIGKLLASITLLGTGSCMRPGLTNRGSTGGSVRLIFYTDVHARTEWDTPHAMARAAAAINAQKPDLVLAGGDLITDGFQSEPAAVAPRWAAYMQMQRTIRADVYPAIGNHDLVAARPQDGSPAAQNPRSIYLSYMGLKRTYYSFDAVGYHFIILDSIHITEDDYQYQGFIRPEQLEWLQQDLAAVSKATPIVLVTHIPLLSSFFSASRGATFAAKPNRVVVNNRDVFDAFKNRNLILVLQGHLHVKELIRWQNTTFITGGAICGKWWRGAWYGTKEGFSVLTLNGNRVDWRYIDYGWVTRRPVNE